MLDRRAFLTGAGLLGLVSVTNRTDTDFGKTGIVDTAEPLPLAQSSGFQCGVPDCVLSPESMEGPYFIDGLKMRSDIREDRTGVEALIELAVNDATSCTALKGALVELWHCDAQGYYSGHLDQDPNVEAESAEHRPPTDDSTFLRGGQITDELGRVRFRTIFPGWYAGRTVHYHVMVSIGTNEIFTGQLYFDEELTQRVLRHRAYERGPGSAPRLPNDEDFIYLENSGDSTTLHANIAPSGKIVASSVLGVPVRSS